MACGVSRHGVIADFDVTEKMLRYFITKVHEGRHWVKPQVVIAVPVLFSS